MKRLLLLWSGLLVCATAALPVEINGTVRVLPGSASHAASVIVYAESLDRHEVPQPGRYQLLQKDKTFVPHILAIPVGSVVDFPNADPIFHNVFSLSAPVPFDLGLYRAGTAKALQFTAPAIYRVFCNIHPQMTGLLLVLPTSAITKADAQGHYHLDLQPGSYRLTAWSERAQPAIETVTVTSYPGAVPELVLDESHYAEIRHPNKYGQDYPRSAYLSGK